MDNDSGNIIKEKSFDFACDILDMRKLLRENKEFEIEHQIVRSGTSIGANVCEAVQAQTVADFFAKMSIALKEAAETDYWLRLIKHCNLYDDEFVDHVLSRSTELIKIFTSIVKHKDDSVSYEKRG